MAKYDYCVYIGRFQPFHLGHLATVKQAFEEAAHVIIVLGSCNVAPNTKNPFNSKERESMIRDCLTLEEIATGKPAHKRVSFVHVRDYLYDDSKWLTEVQNGVNEITNYSHQVALIGYHKDESSFYLNMFPGWGFIHATPKPKLSATDIRELIFTGKSAAHMVPEAVSYYLSEWQKVSPTFSSLVEEHAYLKSYKAAWTGPYEPVFVTVDAVVTQNNHVLVVRRGENPGKGLYALPGGFVQANERVKDAAFRELKEETSILCPDEVLRSSVKEVKVFDHPGRSLRGRTITHAHYIPLREDVIPRVTAGDDACGARWMPIIDIYKNENNFFDDHFEIVDYFVSNH